MKIADALHKVWLNYICKDDALSKNAVVKSLGDVGIDTYTPNSCPNKGPGLLFFDEFDQSICDFLRESSHCGLEKVLAITTPAATLAEGDVWRILKAGVSDVMVWNDSDKSAKEVLARLERWRYIDDLLRSPLVRNNLIGQSPAWLSALAQMVGVTSFNDASILLIGETGTGKELLAKLLHTMGTRPDKGDLVVLDCTTIVPELSGSEFFGHERGAFTGAVASRDGAFAMANGGSLFLDEVGDLPLELQAQLLRVIQERTYKRVGGNTWYNTDFRLICATNKDLSAEVKNGGFRSDLFYRIAGETCRVPPLRERTEDIIQLATHFIKQLRPEEKPLEMNWFVKKFLLSRKYPGNVRELQQLVSRMMYRHVGTGPITIGDIPEDERNDSMLDIASREWIDKSFDRSIRRAISHGVGLKDIGRAAENAAFRIALREENDNSERAARKLGITKRAVQERKAGRLKSWNA